MPERSEARPVSYYPVSGQPITDVLPGAGGSIWFTQYDGNTMRASRADHNGVVVATAELAVREDPSGSSPATMSDVIPDSNGGIWALSWVDHRLMHVAPGGATASVPLDPFEYQYALASGPDGRAWVLSCGGSATNGSRHCSAVAVDGAGHKSAYPLPTFSSSYEGRTSSVATGEGVWFASASEDSDLRFLPTDAAFVSTAGVVSPVTLPEGVSLEAPGPNDQVWWRQFIPPYQQATFGRTAPSGSTASSVRYAAEGADDVSFRADPGRSGDLLWAQGSVADESVRDGDVGTFSADGSETTTPIAKNATAIPTNDPDLWSGDCLFGGTLLEASDGSIWVLSGGYPDRVSRVQPSGAFSNYLVGGRESNWVSFETSSVTLGLVESGGLLWFGVNTPTGFNSSEYTPKLASIDPLDPPTPEVAWPGGRDATAMKAIRRAVEKALKSSHVRRVVESLAHGRTARLPFDWVAEGQATVSVDTLGRNGVATVGHGNRRGVQGVRRIPIAPTSNARKALSHAGVRVRVELRFKPAAARLRFVTRRISLNLR